MLGTFEMKERTHALANKRKTILPATVCWRRHKITTTDEINC